MKQQPISIQYLLEIACILVLSYAASLYLPWWIVAVVAGLISFLMNTKVFSFITGFVAIAILWGRVAYGLSAANEHILATKIAAILQLNGDFAPISLILLTAFIGGIVGGLGAWTGKLGRKLL